MTGIDKMTSQILAEANSQADEIRKEAQVEVDKICQQAKEEAQAMMEQISNKSRTKAISYQERMKSAADLRRRTAVLKAKQEIIAHILQKGYDTFCEKEDIEYFKTIEEMLKKFASAQKGKVYFSSRDLKRCPPNFAGTISAIAQSRGGELELSDQAREIMGGFILSYGGVEENCSFEAIFAARKDELQDAVQKVLFL